MIRSEPKASLASVRKRLENVANGWCETIRASQVIPVYPLTQDVLVGDVFLVQTPISRQEREYQKHGFLALDDFRVRLAYTNFSSIYFDNYWKHEFGPAPHLSPVFTNAGGGSSNQVLTAVEALALYGSNTPTWTSRAFYHAEETRQMARPFSGGLQLSPRLIRPMKFTRVAILTCPPRQFCL